MASELSPAEISLKKKCIDCKEWKARNHFYRTTVRGKKKDQDGKYYRKARCKECDQKKYPSKKKTPAEKARATKILAARRAAYRRLAAMNEEGFKILLRDELRERGIRDYEYRSPNGEWNGEVYEESA